MKNLLLATGLLVSVTVVSAQQIATGLTASNGQFIGFYEYKPTDYAANPTEKYPLIIFLHGIGERGNGTSELSRVRANGIPKYINAGHKMRFFWNGKWQTFLVLSPQLSGSYGWWQHFYVDEMIKYAKANMRIDTNRIFLSGLSLGGGGVWYYAGASLSNAQQFAAIAQCCGTCEGVNWCNFANANLPVWGFHASNDGTVGVGCTTGAIGGINSCSPAVKPYMTIWPDGGHWVWDRAFDTAYNYQNPNLYEWFLGQDKSLPVNVRPVANAGPDVTVSTSPGTVNLSASMSTDADGHMERYVWRKVSGPTYGNIVTPVSGNGKTSVINLLVPGTYVFEVKAVDDRADYTTDQVTVTVVSGATPNIPPVTEAGTDQVTSTSIALIDGSGSYDPDGSISTYKWTKVSGPAVYTISNDAAMNPTVSDLLMGTYEFELETTDDQGARTTDMVTIVSNSTILPVKWLYFNFRLTDGHTQLTWATENEYANERFDIQRSDDGKSFVAIGTIKGQDLSMAAKEYAYTDEQPVTKTVYYRLAQYSKDGTVQYSKILTVNPPVYKDVFTCYPNPVKDAVSINVKDAQTGTMVISLFGVDGKLVYREQKTKQQETISTSLDMKHMGKGVYMLEVTIGGNTRMMKKIVKQ